MTVTELVENLKRLDGDTIVIMPSDNFEQKGALVEVGGYYEGRFRIKQLCFYDSFDRETYDANVYVSSNSGKKGILLTCESPQERSSLPEQILKKIKDFFEDL